jgi:hypothetical protein
LSKVDCSRPDLRISSLVCGNMHMSSTKPKPSNLSTQRLLRHLRLPASFPGAEAPTSDVGVEAPAQSRGAEAPVSIVGAEAPALAVDAEAPGTEAPALAHDAVQRLPRCLVIDPPCTKVTKQASTRLSSGVVKGSNLQSRKNYLCLC